MNCGGGGGGKICTNPGVRGNCPWDAYVNGTIAECTCCNSHRKDCLIDCGNPSGKEIEDRVLQVAREQFGITGDTE